MARADVETGDPLGILIGARSYDKMRDATIDADLGLLWRNPNGTWSLAGNVDVPRAARAALMATSLAYHFAGGQHFKGVRTFEVPQSATMKAALQAELARRADANAKIAMHFLKTIGLPKDADALAAVL